jgi:hypothetical protein
VLKKKTLIRVSYLRPRFFGIGILCFSAFEEEEARFFRTRREIQTSNLLNQGTRGTIIKNQKGTFGKFVPPTFNDLGKTVFHF